MKKYLLSAAVFILLVNGCSGDDNNKLEAYNPEVFAFDIGDEYEVNATVRIKGFKLDQQGDEFTSSVSYELDLVRPEGVTENEIVTKIEDLVFSEKVNDAGIDIQFTLDSSYAPGKYSVIFNLKDNLSEKSVTTSTEFTLE
jgi:hypothetical protein